MRIYNEIEWFIESFHRTHELHQLKNISEYNAKMVYDFSKAFSLDTVCGARTFNHERYFNMPDDVRGTWHGFIPLDGKYESAMISTFNYEPVVIRPFPKFQKLTNEEQPDVVLPYYEGERITLFTFPDGKIHGKTDYIEFIYRTAANTVNYQMYLEDCPKYEELTQMIRGLGKSYAVNVIVFNSDLSAFNLPFYKENSGFVVVNIEELTQHCFLTVEETMNICDQYKVPVIRPCLVDDPIVEELGGYMFENQVEEELTYVVQYDESLVDKKQAIIRDSWEMSCNNNIVTGYYLECFSKFMKEYGAEELSVISLDDWIDEGIKRGKKLTVEQFIDRLMTIYKSQVYDKSLGDIWDILDTRLIWSGWERKVGKDYILNLIADWLQANKESIKEENLESITIINDIGKEYRKR